MAQMNRNVNLEEIDSDALFGIDALKNQTIFQKIVFFGSVIAGVLLNVLLPLYCDTPRIACILMFLGLLLIRFKNTDESCRIFRACMMDAVRETDGFYYNFSFDTFVCYEVEGSRITITEYLGNAANKRVTTGRVGSERAPTGEIVRETSAYGRVRFDIKSVINGDMVTKTKDIYCTLEINN